MNCTIYENLQMENINSMNKKFTKKSNFIVTIINKYN